jgi:hypothetical protein
MPYTSELFLQCAFDNFWMPVGALFAVQLLAFGCGLKFVIQCSLAFGGITPAADLYKCMRNTAAAWLNSCAISSD